MKPTDHFFRKKLCGSIWQIRWRFVSFKAPEARRGAAARATLRPGAANQGQVDTFFDTTNHIVLVLKLFMLVNCKNLEKKTRHFFCKEIVVTCWLTCCLKAQSLQHENQLMLESVRVQLEELETFRQEMPKMCVDDFEHVESTRISFQA